MMTPGQTLDLDEFMQGLVKRNPGEIEFHQAVEEVATSVIPFINEHPKYDRTGSNDHFPGLLGR